MMELEVHLACECCDSLRHDAATELCRQWGGTTSSRLQIMQSSDHTQKGTVKTAYIVHKLSIFFGYFEIQDALLSFNSDITGVCSNAVVTTVLVAHQQRRKGIGLILLDRIEKIARERQYSYIYLWTSDSVGFYKKFGYYECESTSMNSKVLKTVDSIFVKGLESMLCRKNSAAQAMSETLSNNVEETSIWLRKRINMFESKPIFRHENRDKAKKALTAQIALLKRKMQLRSSKINICHHLIPWVPQIGPSCGIAALSMVYWHIRCNQLHPESISDRIDREWPLNPSILSIALQNNFTFDGEIFGIRDLLRLAQLVLPNCSIEIIEVSSLTEASMLQMIDNSYFFIFPYDSDAASSAPCCLRGGRAHYAVITGYVLIHSDMDMTTSETFCSDWYTEVIDSNTTAHSCDGSTYDTPQSSRLALIATQGLSPQWLVAPLDTWIQSNSQLEDCIEPSDCQDANNTSLHRKMTARDHWKRNTVPENSLKGKCLKIAMNR